MIEKYVSAPKTLKRLRASLSGPHIDDFADALKSRVTLIQVRFVTYVPQLISAGSCNAKAAPWRT